MMEAIRQKMNSRAAKHIGNVVLVATGLIGIAVGTYELAGITTQPEQSTAIPSTIPQLNALNTSWFSDFSDEKLSSSFVLAIGVGATILGGIGISKSIDEYDAHKSQEVTPDIAAFSPEQVVDWDSLLIDDDAQQLTYKGITYST